MDKMNEGTKCFLPDRIRLSQVHLRTANLANLVEFYTGPLGFKATPGSAGGSPASITSDNKRAITEGLGAFEGEYAISSTANGPGFLLLTEDKHAVPRPPRSTGLFHVAIRYPARQDLSRAYRRLLAYGYPVAGASDHGVSEAIYLSDPEGNGIELYSDRPRSQWHWEKEQIVMVTEPLDLDNLLAMSAAEPALSEPPPQTTLGHVHLNVASLTAAEQFYGNFLGLAVTQRSYPGALFFAAGRYHHHIGVNIWAGKSPAPANSLGLVSYRMKVPVSEILYCLGHRAPLLGYETRTQSQEEGRSLLQIRDPNGTWFEIEAAQKTAVLPSTPKRKEHAYAIHANK